MAKIVGKEFDSFLELGCSYCELLQEMIARQLANPEISGVKPTITKCSPVRILTGEGGTGRNFTVIYVAPDGNSPIVYDLVEETCPDNLGSMGLNTTR